MISFTVAVGGAFGAISRYLLGLGLMRAFRNSKIPIAMILVNFIGSFALGYVVGTYNFSNLGLYKMMTIGFLGAFTTFSTFSLEAIQLFIQKNYTLCFTYVFVSIAGSIVLFVIAIKL